ncbi:MAG: hypothetical protein FH748_13040 [Balneolaceae bacterium]|nr:hypothetical protein [Balneolaceae bacterium]
MNKERLYIGILSVMVFLFVLVQILQPEPIDWSDSFSATDKIPYGSYITQHLLGTAFPGQEVTVNTSPVFNFDTTASHSQNWIFIHNTFGLDPWETEILLKEAEEGSSVFIAARNFTQQFADTLNLKTKFGNPVIRGNALLDDDTSRVNFSNPSLSREEGWPYLQTTTEAFFTSVDSSRTTILGTDAQERPNYIRTNWGKGNIYLHSNPTLFSNYVVKEKTGADYAFTALSYLPVQPTIWDEYYKPGRLAGGSAVRYLVSKKHLRWAWFLSLIGVVLFLVFKGRRKQRIIPAADPPQNSSIEFAQTIGSLYLEKGNHKLIAEKKIQYFLDYIRSHIGLETHQQDQQFKERLAQRSAIPRGDVLSLFDLIEMIPNQDTISKKELTVLTERIDAFYNKSQR